MDLFNKLRDGLDIGLLVLIAVLGFMTWSYSGKYDTLLKDNASLIATKAQFEASSKGCSDSVEAAAKVDQKKAEDVKAAQNKVLGLANAQIELAQNILLARPKTSDLCKESFDLIEKTLSDLKKEGAK